MREVSPEAGPIGGRFQHAAEPATEAHARAAGHAKVDSTAREATLALNSATPMPAQVRRPHD